MFHARLRLAVVAAAFAAPLLTIHTPVVAQHEAERLYATLDKLPTLVFELWPGDFNGDGITDLVAGTPSTGIAVAIGRGDGTFFPEQIVATGLRRPIGVGDVNGDGLLDVVASTGDSFSFSETYILPGRGDGTFDPPVMTALAIRAPVYVVDMNGDDVPDVVGLGSDSVRVFPGHGNFTFGTPTVLRTRIMVQNLVVTDLNGDSYPDAAAVTLGGRSVDLFYNEFNTYGDLVFTGAAIPLGRSGLGITAWDVNGDGAMDLIASGGDRVASIAPWWANGFVYVLLGDGHGGFADPVAYPTNNGPQTAVVGDFNGDGLPDIATGNLSYGYACESWQHLWDSVSLLPGRGDGTFGPPSSYALGNAESVPDSSLYRRAHHRLNTSDLNADGRTDLIASPGAILLGSAPSANRSPVADAGSPQQLPSGEHSPLRGSAMDPDNDWLTFTWTDASGRIVGNVPRPCVGGYGGLQTFTLTVSDGRGGVSVDTVTHRFGSLGPLPPGWTLGDIGTVAVPGSSAFDGTTYTVTGAGADIWGTSDAFHFAHSLQAGDFEATVRVASVEHVHDWTKAGLMIRESLAPDARHAFVLATPGTIEGTAFQRRPVAGDVSVHTAGPSIAPPVWLRLRREGDRITAFVRAFEHDPWVRLDEQTLPDLPENVRFGLAVTSHSDGVAARATFDTLTIAPIEPTLPNGWTSTDVGPVGAPGGAAFAADTFALAATGVDIWGYHDAFHFAYLRGTGDFDVRARVTGLDAPHEWSKAGLMIRESLDADARHHFLLASGSRGLAHQWRPEQGGLSLHTALGDDPLPVWFRMRRTGSTVALFWSADGVTWMNVASTAFAGEVLVGLALTSHDGSNQAIATFDSVQATPGPADDWAAVDLGAVNLEGSTAFDGRTYTISASGADIWNTEDAFRFLHQPLAGDGRITAKIVSLAGTHQWAKAGVMIRTSTDPSAAHAFMLVSLSQGLAFQRRIEDGGISTHTNGGDFGAPHWVRLTRTSDLITASVSPDGIEWFDVGADTFRGMPSTALAGLAVTSHDNAALATAEFTDVVVETAAPPLSLAITSPLAGSLLAASATFAWSGAGDEFWLEIGSAPGRADYYSSGSLGTATQHTVPVLPLNGAPMHVRVRRRVGASFDFSSAQYTASIRRGLAVITDFADRRLEDWTGAGIRTVSDLQPYLTTMEEHWAWLSRGRERIAWEIIRVELPVNAVPGVFPGGWGAFRNAVASLIRQQVALEDYDVDADGEIDAAWLIVSSGNLELDYSIGGSSVNGGVNMFADGQASESVVGGAYGNFNHELGHLLGLVDMYGPFDTLDGLTLMSFSWALPARDFAAYERVTLGWVQPRVLTQTTRDVWLPSELDRLAAVKVPTAHPNEYFLIEYRRRPDTGFGSDTANPPFDGLAVYHVLEGSSMFQDPSIVRLEPADGIIEAAAPQVDRLDFVFPENPVLLRPLVLRSYDGQEVFRIENVAWRGGGLGFDVIIP